MERRLYHTPRGRISNSGDRAVFSGRLPCPKAQGGLLHYRSIAELVVGVFLMWSKEVVAIAYEIEKLVFDASDDLPRLTCWPDFSIVLTSGEIQWIEAKSSRAGLSAKKKAQLELTEAHFARSARSYRVIYADELRSSGLSDTILLLLPYGLSDYPAQSMSWAMQRLQSGGAAYVETWRRRAQAAGVPLDLLYHLLYHERLPLLYRPMLPVELVRCRG